MELRRFRWSDAEDTYGLYYAAIHEGASRFYSADHRLAWAPNADMPAAWPDRLADQVAYVAEEDGTLLGFISMTRDGHLDLLYVAPAKMGQGVAAALYDQLIADPEIAPLAAFDTQASHFTRRFLLKRGWPDAPVTTVERFGRQLEVFQMRLERG